ncbi:MAG: GNAT family N-acetyltransferase [Bacteroidota bacterium]
MNIQHKSDETEGVFFIEQDGKAIGKLTYNFSGGTKLVIDHTEVSPKHKGEGLGKELVKAAVEFARKNNYKLLPVCPYAKVILLGTKEYADVLVPGIV